MAIRDLVTRALSVLPVDNRLALSLFLVNGYSHQEVADLTGVPLTTAKGRIERAKRKLATEVLQMVEDTLKSNVPDEEFTLETVRKSLEEAREAIEAKELGTARALAEEALKKLSSVKEDEAQQTDLRLEALSVLGQSTFFADPDPAVFD